jgi:hypothetical protein
MSADPVSWYTTTPAVTLWHQVPMLETMPASQYATNRRLRSGWLITFVVNVESSRKRWPHRLDGTVRPSVVQAGY